MRVSIDELQDLGRAALQRQGHSPQDTERILEVLFYAELRGNNQGLVKLIGPGLPVPAEAGPMQIDRPSDLSAVVNGNHQNGILVMRAATDLVIEIASERGMAIVATHNTNTSTGAIGFYARQIAEASMVGFVFAGSRPAVAPLGASQPVFGTNPLAVGIPSTDGTLVFDMATSAMTWYGLVTANQAGESIPSGVAYGADGRETTDPAAVLAGGALRTFDPGPKSFGLSLIVELLTGPLTGAAAERAAGESWGNLLLAWKPDLLGDADGFARHVAIELKRVKSARPQDGVEEVILPGERGDRLTRQHTASGSLEMDDKVLEALRLAAGTSTPAAGA